MPLPLSKGIVYAEMAAHRLELFHRHAPALKRRAATLLNEVDGRANDNVLYELNDVSLSLGALSPCWVEFSVACFGMLFEHAACGTKGVVATLKESYDRALHAERVA